MRNPCFDLEKMQSDEQTWLRNYWEHIAEVPVVPPKLWPEETQHFLLGPQQEIHAYMRERWWGAIRGREFLEIPYQTANKIVYIEDTFELCMVNHFLHSGQIQTAPKQTLILLSGWWLSLHSNPYIIRDNISQVFDSLVSLCVNSHLCQGVEIDIVSGSPAILEPLYYAPRNRSWKYDEVFLNDLEPDNMDISPPAGFL